MVGWLEEYGPVALRWCFKPAISYITFPFGRASSHTRPALVFVSFGAVKKQCDEIIKTSGMVMMGGVGGVGC